MSNDIRIKTKVDMIFINDIYARLTNANIMNFFLNTGVGEKNE